MISGETMSIFEPIPRESHWEDEEPDDEEDDFIPAGPSGPRSIRIAGIVVAGIALFGLIVSNVAEREPQPRPLLPSVQVDPGAAAVEGVDVPQTIAPSASASTAPLDTDSSIEPVDTGDRDGIDDRESRRSKGDDKPGNGNGRGRGRD